jgi:hypothetical protein
MLPWHSDPISLLASVQLFFALLVGHAIADYPLQGAFLASHKSRHRAWHESSDEGQGLELGGRCLWVHCMTAHSFIQAGMVWLLTGSFLFFLIEFILHWVIDAMKCEGLFGFTTDQIFHVICKAAFVAALYLGFSPPF